MSMSINYANGLSIIYTDLNSYFSDLFKEVNGSRPRLDLTVEEMKDWCRSLEAQLQYEEEQFLEDAAWEKAHGDEEARWAAMQALPDPDPYEAYC